MVAVGSKSIPEKQSLSVGVTKNSENNLENELKLQINYETNRQLNQFSLIYYKKLKKNTNIYENK